MMIAFVIATMIALAAAAAAGWLLGVRRGRGARDDLATATAAAQARAEDAARVAAAADAQAAEAMAGAAQAREELMRVRAGTIAMREQVAQLSTARDAALDDARAAHSELVTATAEHSAVRAQLARLGTEHAAIFVVSEHALTGVRLMSGQRSHAFELRVEDGPIGLGGQRDQPRDPALACRRVQRIDRLVVSRAPNLRAGVGVHDASRDPHCAVDRAHAAAQDIARQRRNPRAAHLGRNYEALGTVEH